jgi:hypothetical protein
MLEKLIIRLLFLILFTAKKNIAHEPRDRTRDSEPKSEERQGTKRKTDQLETGDNKPTSVPIKKAKTIKEVPKSTSVHVAPGQNSASASSRQNSASATPRQNSASSTPRQKPAAPIAAPSFTNKNSRKRSNPTDDAFTEDPKTPAPPLKKPRVNTNDTTHEGNSKKPQPIRRSGNVLFDLKCKYVENHFTRNIYI